MPWWFWTILGLVLLMVEVAMPSGFVIFFFGLGALSVSSFSYFDIKLPLWAEWMAFASISVVLFVPVRWVLSGDRRKNQKEFREEIRALEDIGPGETGRGDHRGTVCSVHNAGASVLVGGKVYKVDRVEGITMEVSGEEQ